jgi:hypothetical protein
MGRLTLNVLLSFAQFGLIAPNNWFDFIGKFPRFGKTC